MPHSHEPSLPVAASRSFVKGPEGRGRHEGWRSRRLKEEFCSMAASPPEGALLAFSHQVLPGNCRVCSSTCASPHYRALPARPLYLRLRAARHCCWLLNSGSRPGLASATIHSIRALLWRREDRKRGGNWTPGMGHLIPKKMQKQQTALLSMAAACSWPGRRAGGTAGRHGRRILRQAPVQ